MLLVGLAWVSAWLSGGEWGALLEGLRGGKGVKGWAGGGGQVLVGGFYLKLLRGVSGARNFVVLFWGGRWGLGGVLGEEQICQRG